MKCGVCLGHGHCSVEDDGERKFFGPSQNIAQDFDCQYTRGESGTFMNSINSEW